MGGGGGGTQAGGELKLGGNSSWGGIPVRPPSPSVYIPVSNKHLGFLLNLGNVHINPESVPHSLTYTS